MNPDVTIVMAEDDEASYRLTRRVLSREGLDDRMIWLKDGQKVIQYLQERFCGPQVGSVSNNIILLLDLRMPHLDGFDVLRFVKSHEQLKWIPVIVVSSDTNPEDIDRCREFGCYEYLIKPVDYRLLSVMEQAYEQGQDTAAN